ncbi:MAG: glycine/sarcosine/betaine reductase selenoprotein B family protein [Deferrisomatales bacterium]
MTDTQPAPESLEEFKDSFFYGTRGDLAFKFLKNLPAEEAGEFFRSLLDKLGQTIDDGDADRLVQHACEWQARAYGHEGAGKWGYESGPFVPLAKPAKYCRLALLTSSGHFAEGADPEPFGVKGMTQEEATRRIMEFLKAPPDLCAIPSGTPSASLCVRHGGYDVRAAQTDPNVVFALDRLRELEGEGAIGELAPTSYSFVGACSQLRLLKESAPAWVARIQEEKVDALLLVPV